MRSRSLSGGNPTKFFNTNSLAYGFDRVARVAFSHDHLPCIESMGPAANDDHVNK
jgi:hypothetical protein